MLSVHGVHAAINGLWDVMVIVFMARRGYGVYGMQGSCCLKDVKIMGFMVLMVKNRSHGVNRLEGHGVYGVFK